MCYDSLEGKLWTKEMIVEFLKKNGKGNDIKYLKRCKKCKEWFIDKDKKKVCYQCIVWNKKEK
jgi:hypothetical protein